MFSLIITIISIALVAALAVATLYYGGTAFNRGADGARAAQLINEGQQVNGAVAMARADVAQGVGTVNFANDTLATLQTASYLSQVPAAFAANTPLTQGFVTSRVTAAVATEVQNRAGGAVLADAASEAAITTGTTQVYGARTVTGNPAATPASFFYRF